jgi:hypothetical protein
MVELRKLMDREETTEHYPVLRLFCNWTVHTNLDRSRAAESLMREFDDAVESVRSGSEAWSAGTNPNNNAVPTDTSSA